MAILQYYCFGIYWVYFRRRVNRLNQDEIFKFVRTISAYFGFKVITSAINIKSEDPK